MIEDQRRPGLLQTSKMEGFAGVVEGYIIAKFSILDFWGSPRYASVSRTEMTFQNKLKGLLENSRWATGIINTGFTKLRVARSFVIGQIIQEYGVTAHCHNIFSHLTQAQILEVMRVCVPDTSSLKLVLKLTSVTQQFEKLKQHYSFMGGRLFNN